MSSNLNRSGILAYAQLRAHSAFRSLFSSTNFLATYLARSNRNAPSSGGITDNIPNVQRNANLSSPIDSSNSIRRSRRFMSLGWNLLALA